MEGRFDFHFQAHRTPPNRGKHFLGGLDGARGPAVLLSLERIDVHGQFRGTNHIRKKNKFPAPVHLGAVRQIEIFGQGVVLPAAGGFNRLPAPDARCPVKIEKGAGPIAGWCAPAENDHRRGKMDWIHVSRE